MATTFVSRDTMANTITVTTTSLSPFVLSAAGQASIGWIFSGTTDGGSIDFTVGGVFLSVTTTAAQTAALVATAVAAAINGDATLSAAGITATVNGGTVTTTGRITSSTVGDTGLSAESLFPAVKAPALSGVGVVLLAAVFLALGATQAMRRLGSVRA